MKRLFTILLFVFTCFTVTSLMAQVKTPAPSPGSKFTQKVGLSEISVDYSRPGVKGRKIFGGLVPYGEMWRTGANASTDVMFSDDATVGGNEIKAGTYALYTIPGESLWTIIFYEKADHWGTPGDDFKDDLVAVKFDVEPQPMPFDIETFTIATNNITSNSAELMMYWERTYVGFPVTFSTDKMVMSSIEKTMNGPSANDYYRSARYYMDTEKDLATAHKWITKATEMRDDAFWMFRTKSQIEAQLGKYAEAIETAKQSRALAEKAGNKQYVKFNDEAIAKWSKM